MKEAIRPVLRGDGFNGRGGPGTAVRPALEREANCLINSRLARLRARKKRMGMTRRDYMALTKLDAIAVDKGLRTAFEGIVARETARTAASGLPPGSRGQGGGIGVDRYCRSGYNQRKEEVRSC